MLVYFHIPYVRIIFYVVTIVFHAFLLVKAALGSRFVLAVLLLIPVTAVTLALWKFLSRAAVRIRLSGSEAQLDTLFRSRRFKLTEMQVQYNKIVTSDGTGFIINISKAETLVEKLKNINRTDGPG